MTDLSYAKLNSISKEYGDAFFLLDLERFEDNCKRLEGAFRSIYPTTRIAYSYKTNYTKAVVKKVNELGCAAEVVSQMELSLALKVADTPADIYYNGPYKKEEYIEELMLLGGHVNLDGEYELSMVEDIAGRHSDKELTVGLRCNVDIGQEEPSRFGFDVESGELMAAFNRINRIPNVRVNGLHCHIPNRSLDTYKERVLAMRKILELFGGYSWDYISFGGGYMGRVDEQMAEQMAFAPPTYEDYAEVVAGFMKDYFEGIFKPLLIIEPGTGVVADCMQLVSRVVNIKTARDKKIATLTASRHLMNPVVSNINRPIEVYSDSAGEYFEKLDMAGYTCIEGDYVYRGFSGRLSVGDFVVFCNTGSYSVVMKPPFILPGIPVLSIVDDNVRVIKRAETAEDIFGTFED